MALTILEIMLHFWGGGASDGKKPNISTINSAAAQGVDQYSLRKKSEDGDAYYVTFISGYVINMQR